MVAGMLGYKGLGYKVIQILEFIKAKKRFFISRGKRWFVVFRVLVHILA
jgi:hypothetical protein